MRYLHTKSLQTDLCLVVMCESRSDFIRITKMAQLPTLEKTISNKQTDAQTLSVCTALFRRDSFFRAISVANKRT